MVLRSDLLGEDFVFVRPHIIPGETLLMVKGDVDFNRPTGEIFVIERIIYSNNRHNNTPIVRIHVAHYPNEYYDVSGGVILAYFIRIPSNLESLHLAELLYK